MDLLRDGLQALKKYLASVPSLEVEEMNWGGNQNNRPGQSLRVRLPGGEQLLALEIKGNGQPRYARQAADRLFRLTNQQPQVYGIFIAPYISPVAAEICTQANIGYADLSGNCRLAFQQIFILRENQPNRYITKKELASLFAPKSERILRVLLTFPYRSWKTTTLANAARVSLGMVSHVKKQLSEREWVRSEADGFVLTAPFDLLQTWSENYSFRNNKRFEYYTIQSPADFDTSLADYCTRAGIEYALTGFSASARLAPAVRYQRAMAYVQGDIPALAAELRLKVVTSGSNVNLLSPYDEGVFFGASSVDGIQVASQIQVYLDLKNYRGRGEEAAEYLFNQVIKPLW
ncbi:MAG: hypothetical protein KJ606_07575 [Chloroflexi bacterium]|nr:hypothetical protein [Chloroflexota bacterium]